LYPRFILSSHKNARLTLARLIEVVDDITERARHGLRISGYPLRAIGYKEHAKETDMKRRDFSIATVTALAATGLGVLRTANAQQLGAVKMMIPANPGGGWDQTGRALATAMQSAKTVQTVQFENKGGAARLGSHNSSTARRAIRTR
jgi:hypothetical protein